MRAIISAKLLASKAAQPRDKPFEIYDRRLRGFTLRVQPSGVRSYYARWGRSDRAPLGQEREYKPDEARERCEKALGNVAHGRHPLYGLDGASGLTLGQFVTDTYEPWLRQRHPRNAAKQLKRLRRYFGKWLSRPLLRFA